MIYLHQLQKIYNRNKENEIKALRDISLHIKKGEFVAVTGTSGAGKSTFLKVLGCLERPSEGEYFLDGKDITRLSGRKLGQIRNGKIGFVVQNFALIEDETVGENIAAPMYFSRGSVLNAEQSVLYIAQKLGIAHLAGTRVNRLSGGNKQRTAIARALIHNPDLILADEPTGALDSENTEAVMDVFKSMHHMGKTILIATHDEKVADYCDRRIILSDGSIKEEQRGAGEKKDEKYKTCIPFNIKEKSS